MFEQIQKQIEQSGNMLASLTKEFDKHLESFREPLKPLLKQAEAVKKVLGNLANTFGRIPFGAGKWIYDSSMDVIDNIVSGMQSILGVVPAVGNNEVPLPTGEAPIKSAAPGAPTVKEIFSTFLARRDGVPLHKLTPDQCYTLGRHVFGNGPGAHMLELLDKEGAGKGQTMIRMIALGRHEGGLKFGRQNKDPASGYNFGTFQIGGRGSTPAISKRKYNTCLAKGIELYKQRTGISLKVEELNAADQDVLTHVGYIEIQCGGKRTFEALANPDLTDDQLVVLMADKIQVGIRKIGLSVLKDTRYGYLRAQSGAI